MAGPIPTKKIPQLTAYGAPLNGDELLEIWSVNTSRRIRTRDFVLPVDSVITVTSMAGLLPGSRRLTQGIGIALVDGGGGGDLEINATGAVAGPANPTAQVGLTPVNGALVTYMRSDGAPALSQAIAPTWTALHVFSAGADAAANDPFWRITELDAAANNRVWEWAVVGEQLRGRVGNDALGAYTNWITVDRTGNTVDTIATASTSFTWNASQVLTVATAFANPTASVGLAAVNGVATTAMRSDAAPAIDQAIVPTWTGMHTFTGGGGSAVSIMSSGIRPQTDWNETDGAANNRRWRIEVQTEQFHMRVVDDAATSATTWLSVDRTLNVVDSIDLTSTALTWNASAILSVATAFANPTGTVGLAAVNGVATTALRSDGAPALSQAIAPTWTAQHIFSLVGSGTAYPVSIRNNLPGWSLREADAAASNQDWVFFASGEQLAFQVTDSAGTGNSWLTVDRTGTTVDTVTFPGGVVTLSAVATTALPNITLTNTNPVFQVFESDAAANNGRWQMVASAAVLSLRAVSDDSGTTNNIFQVARSGSTVTSFTLPTTTTGSFLVGTTATLAASRLAHFLAPTGNNVAGIFKNDAGANAQAIDSWNAATAGDNRFIAFHTEAAITERGTISYNRGAGLVAYNTTSDSRRKKNIVNAPEPGSLIDQIQVRSFDWTESDIHVDYWLVAQELYGIFPIAVSVGGESRDWAIDPSKLIPLLIKEVQSIRRRLVDLETPGNSPGN
jgi:hypothetical protein